MKTIYIFLVTFIAALYGSAYADVLIKGDQGIQLLLVNGQEPILEDGTFSQRGINLSNGKNQILVAYATEIKRSGGDYDLEYTDPFVLFIDTSNESLLLAAPEIKSINALQEFNRSGTWVLVNANNQPIPYKTMALRKEGFQLNRDYPAELAAFNRTDHPAAIKTVRIPQLKVSASNANPDINVAQNTPEAMLHYWFNQSDEATQRRFKVWINQQPTQH